MDTQITTVGIVDYGAGNLRSLSNALTHLGFNWFVSNKTRDLDSATHLILPGVGSFKYGMDRLHALGLVDFLRKTRKPLLGICLGMQLMAKEGFEGGHTLGLGLVSGRVEKLPEPHVGWDEWKGKDYYFVHHYAFVSHNLFGKDYVHSWAHNKGRLQWCQFHPEKSQEAGLQFLKEFCEYQG